MRDDLSDREIKIRSDAKVIFNSPQGERFLRLLRAEAGFWIPMSTLDPITAARIEGQRNVVTNLMRLSGQWIDKDEELAESDYPPLPEED